jgi:hypothetical protein
MTLSSAVRTFPLLPVIAAILLFASCAKEDAPNNNTIVTISDLLPKDNEISGWPRKAGSDAGWLATNSGELQQRIDGGFELFANHGFVEAAMQQFTGTVNGTAGIELEVQVYNQTTAAQADAVFDDPNNVFANPITPNNPPSTKAQITRNLATTMKFTKGKYYVLLTVLSSDDKAQDILEVFANNVAAKIP